MSRVDALSGPRKPEQLKYTDAEHQEFVNNKRRKRMARVDQLSPALRALVHEYGLPVVQTLMDLGVKEPRHIKHVVETVLDEFSPTRGAFSSQGIRAPMLKPKEEQS